MNLAKLHHLVFYYDPISPYAYLAFKQLPWALEGLSYHVSYKPILFAAMLKTYGQLGPAEIAPKRDWTYRQVLWQAKTLKIPLTMPATHPFNPLALLRLGCACSDSWGATNRYVTEQLFQHVWTGGLEASDPVRLEALSVTLKDQMHHDAQASKVQLKSNTEEALRLGCFGVPSIVVDDKVFWGLDALPMLREYLQGDDWFASGGYWEAATQVGTGISREPSSEKMGRTP